jgi:hypothetical protein
MSKVAAKSVTSDRIFFINFSNLFFVEKFKNVIAAQWTNPTGDSNGRYAVQACYSQNNRSVGINVGSWRRYPDRAGCGAFGAV